MKIKKLAICLMSMAILPLVSCEPSTPTTSSGSGNDSGTSNVVDTSLPDVDGTTLNMSIMYQKGGTRMKFPSAGDSDAKVKYPYVHKDGDKTYTYNAGDWKPVWKDVQERLGFVINDVTSTSETTIANAFKTLQAKGFTGVDIAQGSSIDIITEGTTAGTILDLSKYLDLMPNFSKYLEENPAIRAFISDASGAIYYAPYFDGFDDIERMLLLRSDWVEKLLDGELPTDTNVKINKAYTAFYEEKTDTKVTVVKADGSGSETVNKKHDQNIITIQNNLSSMDGASLVKALRDYIDTTYVTDEGKPYYTKRSDVFLGQNAAYDVDELIALFRCVKACPATLTGDASTDIVPLYPRDDTNDRTADLWRFTQFFGVRGGESRSGYLYIDSDGKVVDARGTTEMRDALNKMHDMYSEGLIMQDFTNNDATAGTEFRTYYVTKNRGFATYDYNQTSTVLNDNADFRALGEDARFVSVLPATAKWNGSDEYSFFTESWRSVKSEGWFITSATAKDPAKLNKALKLFDYFWSPEGNRMMSYGPDYYLAKNADGSIKTMDYQGKQVPVLSDETLKELAELAKGNYTNYYRYWIGGTYPVGYIKEQGMEYQTVSSYAKPALDMINKAIEVGVLKHVNFKLDNADMFYNIVPTTFSLTEMETNAIKNNFTELDTAINNTKGKSNIWSDIVKNGFGSGTLPSYEDYCDYINTTLKCTQLVAIYNNSYARMIGKK